MALKSFPSKLASILLGITLFCAATPGFAQAKGMRRGQIPVVKTNALTGQARNNFVKIHQELASTFISLRDFAAGFSGGQPDRLAAVYVQGLLAARIVQQPADVPEFVSPRGNIVTQFSTANRYGATGLLAHNYLVGASFHKLVTGHSIHLIFADGHVVEYLVTSTLRYQALEPRNPASNFVDLLTGTRLSAAKVVSSAYNRPGSLVLQTCIEAEGNKSWGRLFVIAEPVIEN